MIYCHVEPTIISRQKLYFNSLSRSQGVMVKERNFTSTHFLRSVIHILDIRDRVSLVKNIFTL